MFSNQLSEGFSPIHFLLDNLLSLNTLKSFGITFPYFDSVFHQTSESSDDESIFCNDHVFIRLAKFQIKALKTSDQITTADYKRGRFSIHKIEGKYF